MGATLVECFQERPFELRLAVTGSLDHPGAEILAERFADALLADIRVVVIDVEGVETLDHDGLKALVSLRSYAVAAGVACDVAHAPPLLQHLLALTRLEPSDEDDAARFNVPS